MQSAFEGNTLNCMNWPGQTMRKWMEMSCCRICKRYDEMADKVSDIPDATKELVNTQQYLRHVKKCIEFYKNGCVRWTLT